MKKWRLWAISIAAILLIIAAQWWVSYHWLQVTHKHVVTNRVSEAVRIAVVADLHTSVFGENQSELAATILAEKPDVVCMAGDMINEDGDAEQLAGVISLVQKLADACPVYVSLGNHEEAYVQGPANYIEAIKTAGAVVLDLAYEDVEIAGQKLRIGGMYEYAFSFDWDEPTSQENMDPAVYDFLIEFEETERFRLMLAHRPDTFIFGNAGETWEIDLGISGHVHGGQVRLPLIGGLWAPDQGWFPDYVDGIHELGTMRIAITRGLGSQPEAMPRLGNRPEILVIDLVPERSASDGQ